MYIIKRVLFLIPTILGVILIIYAIMSITPGTPGQAVLGSSASQQDIDAYNEMIGYNKPFLQKYAIYIGNMLKGDFGTSYFTKQSVFKEILPRYMLTIQLALMGVVLATLIGVPIGVYAAVRQYSLWDTIPSVVSFLLAAVPTFVLGTLLLYEFSLKLYHAGPSDVYPAGGTKYSFYQVSHAGIDPSGLRPDCSGQGRFGRYGHLEACSEKRFASGGNANRSQPRYIYLWRCGG